MYNYIMHSNGHKLAMRYMVIVTAAALFDGIGQSNFCLLNKHKILLKLLQCSMRRQTYMLIENIGRLYSLLHCIIFIARVL